MTTTATPVPPREVQLKSRVIRQLEDAGAWVLKTHSAGYQRKGIPDIIVCYRGRFAAIETKRPGKCPTRLQAHRMRQIRDADGVAVVIRDARDVDRLLLDLAAPV